MGRVFPAKDVFAMRRRWALLLALAAASVGGCLTGTPGRPTSWVDRLPPLEGPTGPDAVQMDLAFVEGPLGDRFLDREMWGLADDQVVAADRRAVIEDNGFRVGQVGGITPAGLQARLTSDRTCVNPQRLRLCSGKPTAVPLGPPLPHCRFQLRLDGNTVPVEFERAECFLVIVPTLTADGRTRLQFTPEVRSGLPGQFYRPAADRSGWVVQDDRAPERYPALAWEVTLAVNEYVAVGTRFDRPQTLGHACFVRTEPTPRQRILVIRTGRPAPPVTLAPGETAEELASHRSPPLALQAALSCTAAPSP